MIGLSNADYPQLLSVGTFVNFNPANFKLNQYIAPFIPDNTETEKSCTKKESTGSAALKQKTKKMFVKKNTGIAVPLEGESLKGYLEKQCPDKDVRDYATKILRYNSEEINYDFAFKGNDKGKFKKIARSFCSVYYGLSNLSPANYSKLKETISDLCVDAVEGKGDITINEKKYSDNIDGVYNNAKNRLTLFVDHNRDNYRGRDGLDFTAYHELLHATDDAYDDLPVQGGGFKEDSVFKISSLTNKYLESTIQYLQKKYKSDFVSGVYGIGWYLSKDTDAMKLYEKLAQKHIDKNEYDAEGDPALTDAELERIRELASRHPLVRNVTKVYKNGNMDIDIYDPNTIFSPVIGNPEFLANLLECENIGGKDYGGKYADLKTFIEMYKTGNIEGFKELCNKWGINI